MSIWVKIYGTLRGHRKTMVAGDRAMWLHVCGLLYSNEHLTDGFIAREVLPAVSPASKSPERLVPKLIDADLWHPVDGGWQIHDYLDAQRSADEIRGKRSKDADRKAQERALSVDCPRGQIVDSGATPSGVHEVEQSREEERRDTDQKRADALIPAHLHQHATVVHGRLSEYAAENGLAAVSKTSLARVMRSRPLRPFVRCVEDYLAWQERQPSAKRHKDLIRGYEWQLDNRYTDLAATELLDDGGMPVTAPASNVVPMGRRVDRNDRDARRVAAAHRLMNGDAA